tara:strand:+ start:77 stop:544 length:468 start_codon:yes stop_codon:yes gene_type:complete
MARITVEDCIDKFESRFELVLVASNRARKLHSGESATVEKDNDKPTVIALREIADETIVIENLKDKLIQEYQTVSPLDEEELSLDYDGSDAKIEEQIYTSEVKPDENNSLESERDQTKEEVELSSIPSEGEEDKILDTQNEVIIENVDDKNPENS